MSISTFGDKYDAPAFMTPGDRLADRFPDDDRPTVPDDVIITFQDTLFGYATDDYDTTELEVHSPVYTVSELHDTHGGVGVVGDFGIGAPVLGIVLEDLIALGATRFLIVGGCGTLQPHVAPGDVILVEEAIRDEGTSYHYIEPTDTITATAELVDTLEQHVESAGITPHVGGSWTTDEFYREPVCEIEYCTQEGVLTVEMETATLYAIAQYRDIAAGAILAFFDRLTGDDWEWDDTRMDPEQRLYSTFDIGVDALTADGR